MPQPLSSSPDKIALLRASWLANMPDAVLAEAADRGSFRSLADGALVHGRGDACDGFYTIAQGAVRFSRTTADGDSTTLAVLEAPNWFGEISIFDGLPRTHDGHAVGAATLLYHSRADFRRLLMRHPAIWEHFARMMALRLRATFDLVEEAATLPLSQRLARRLLELAQLLPSALASTAVLAGREVPLTQEELGQLLGKSRQSIAKLLRLWEQDGLLHSHYGRVFIDQPAALGRIAFPERSAPQSSRAADHTIKENS